MNIKTNLYQQSTASYAYLLKLYNSRRKGRDYKVLPGRSTELTMCNDGTLVVRYYQTNIVAIKPDGTFILRTGGWRTRTTKDKINEYTPIQIWQKDFNWFLEWDGKVYEFHRDLMFETNGKVTDVMFTHPAVPTHKKVA